MRGNTTRQIVQMLRDAGAREVHMRITAPPIRHPCHYGIDMSTREEMVAHGRTVDEIARELGADSLAYLSLEGVYEAVGATRETHCDACFIGRVPAARARPAAQGKFAFEPRCRSVRAPAADDRAQRRDPGRSPALSVARPDGSAREALREHFGFDAFRPGQARRSTPRSRAATRSS